MISQIAVMSSRQQQPQESTKMSVGANKSELKGKLSVESVVVGIMPIEINDNTCVVCFKVVEIYSIGECDHPVCYECSTRMRVLCQQNECPICRTDMAKVIFTNEKLTFRQLEIKNRTGLYDKKYRICFASIKFQAAYNKLLEHPCSKCDRIFPVFDSLREHIQRQHQEFFCEICTVNLSVFSFERKSYNRKDLAIHRRSGDQDNKSHRGHPLCEHCDTRFFDRDELFRHLRREHFYCHFCDADGRNLYYNEYRTLRDHFRDDHFLCEEGQCVDEQFTGVFRTEIDLKAHVASTHGQGLGRLAAKQIRTLEFEITLAPRNRQDGSRNGGGSGAASGNGGGNYRQRHDNDFDIRDYQDTAPMFRPATPPRVIDANNEQEFPSLGGSSGATTSITLRPNVSIRTKAYETGGLARTKENFPALGGSSSNVPEPRGSGSYKQGTTASALLKNVNKQASTVAPKSSGMVIHVSNRPSTSTVAKKPPDVNRSNTKDFPSLSSASNRKTNTMFTDTDFIADTSSVYANNIAAKHRSLADGYESYKTDTAASKIAVVQPTETKRKSSLNDTPSAPKINSKQNFPALNKTSAVSPLAPQWVTLTKKQPVESRKSKVAPPPLSISTSENMMRANTNGKSLSAIIATAATGTAANGNKKEKSKPPVKFQEKTVAPTDPKAIKNTKKNPKQFIVVNGEDSESDIVPSATVLSAVSAKHRSLVDGYESVAKTSSKISLVQQKTDEKSRKLTNTVNVPKLNSKNNFPSLAGNTKMFIENLSNNNSKINFTEIIKNNAVNDDTYSKDSNNEDGGDVAIAVAPPGLGESKTKASNIPPPGFQSVTLNSVAKPSNNLTFTTSLGESFSILPAHKYVPPPNAVQRNQALFAHFQNTIANPDVVESFKIVSQLFINNAYHALPYYEHCRIALADKFDAIFPELLVLLPDISKQQELYLVHSQQTKEDGTAAKQSKKRNNNNNNNHHYHGNALEVCATCKQVLISNDLSIHLQSHVLENNFPTLSTTQAGAAASTWRK